MQHKCTKWLVLLACALCTIGFSACGDNNPPDASSTPPLVSSSSEDNSSSEDSSSSGNLISDEKATEGLSFTIRIESDGSHSAQIVGYDGTDTNVVIPSVLSGYPVKSIGKEAFKDCSGLTSVYYKGTESDWDKISIISHGNYNLTGATRYYYSETQPTTSGNYWHYVNGVPTVWE